MSCSLHQAVFEGDSTRVEKLLKQGGLDLGAKDKHGDFPYTYIVENSRGKCIQSLKTFLRNPLGNTALHLAVLLGRKEIVEQLLAYNAPARIKNAQGWSALAEAVSYGDRDMISLVLKALKVQANEQIRSRKPDLVRALKNMPDFYLELKWDFHSWIPLVSRLLPSDICKIYKRGATVRLDSTLVDFSEMRWERGDISFIYDGDAEADNALTIVDNVNRAYQRVRREACGDETEEEIDEEVDLMMSSDIIMMQMSTKNVMFSRAQTGWIFFREDKKEVVGKYPADFYDVSGLILEAKKRREHLSEEDVAKNKAKAQSFANGTSGAGFDVNCDIPRRESLPPPPRPSITWEEYLQAVEAPRLGREMVCKESSKSYRATLAMSNEFPLSVEKLLNLLEVVAPFKYFSKLRDFVNVKLPPGFPVRIDIPVVPTVTATITFQDFEFRKDFDDSLFTIPSDYVEDPNRIGYFARLRSDFLDDEKGDDHYS